jgi:hypothetical protein
MTRIPIPVSLLTSFSMCSLDITASQEAYIEQHIRLLLAALNLPVLCPLAIFLHLVDLQSCQGSSLHWFC